MGAVDYTKFGCPGIGVCTRRSEGFIVGHARRAFEDAFVGYKVV